MRSAALVILLALASVCCGQILNQDASGSSSITWAGSSVGIDLPTGLIKINHYRQPVDAKGVLWGFDLQGENANGSALISDAGELLPKARGSGLIGWTRVFISDNASYVATKNEITALQARIDGLTEQKELMIDDWANQVRGCSDDPTLASVVRAVKGGVLAAKIKAGPVWQRIQETVEIEDATKCPELVALIDRLAKEAKGSGELAELERLKEEITALRTRHETQAEKQRDSQLNVFARLGVEASEFTYDRSDTIATFDSRFRDTLFTPIFGQLGITFRCERHFFGLSFTYAEANNFLALDKREYSYSQVDTNITSGKLDSKKSGTAYSGDYGTFRMATLSFDYLHAVRLAPERFMMIGPYFRWNMSENQDLLPSTSTLGFCVNYIDGQAGKFLGGIYVQTGDLTGELEPKLNNTIQFGLVTRFALSNFFPMESN